MSTDRVVIPDLDRQKGKRCTSRKHVIEKARNGFCDCGAVMVGNTAAKNALVVTVLDSVQPETLAKVPA